MKNMKNSVAPLAIALLGLCGAAAPAMAKPVFTVAVEVAACEGNTSIPSIQMDESASSRKK